MSQALLGALLEIDILIAVRRPSVLGASWPLSPPPNLPAPSWLLDTSLVTRGHLVYSTSYPLARHPPDLFMPSLISTTSWLPIALLTSQRLLVTLSYPASYSACLAFTHPWPLSALLDIRQYPSDQQISSWRGPGQTRFILVHPG